MGEDRQNQHNIRVKMEHTQLEMFQDRHEEIGEGRNWAGGKEVDKNRGHGATLLGAARRSKFRRSPWVVYASNQEPEFPQASGVRECRLKQSRWKLP